MKRVTTSPGAPNGTEAASLRNVTFRRRESAGDAAPFELNVANLALGAGEAVACIGPSGAGKTTLVHLFAGILSPDSGEVTLAGQRLDRFGERERRAQRASQVGLVFQEFELLDYLSALDNMLLPIRLGRGDLSAARDRAHELAESLGVKGLLRRVPQRLSQGERQRVAIARALIASPALVLCDEPTGNLDPKTAGSVLELLLAQAKERNAALLMVTHDHSLLDRFDRVVDVRELGSAKPVETLP